MSRRAENSSSTPQSLQVLLTLLAECFALFGHPTCAPSVSCRVESLSLRYTRGHQATLSSSATHEEAAEGPLPHFRKGRLIGDFRPL